jgi:hypothetical protein
MMGYALGKPQICPGRKKQFPTSASLILEKLKQLAVVGQMGNIEFHVRGNEGLERGLSI